MSSTARLEQIMSKITSPGILLNAGSEALSWGRETGLNQSLREGILWGTLLLREIQTAARTGTFSERLAVTLDAAEALYPRLMEACDQAMEPWARLFSREVQAAVERSCAAAGVMRLPVNYIQAAGTAPRSVTPRAMGSLRSHARAMEVLTLVWNAIRAGEAILLRDRGWRKPTRELFATPVSSVVAALENALARMQAVVARGTTRPSTMPRLARKARAIGRAVKSVLTRVAGRVRTVFHELVPLVLAFASGLGSPDPSAPGQESVLALAAPV